MLGAQRAVPVCLRVGQTIKAVLSRVRQISCGETRCRIRLATNTTQP